MTTPSAADVISRRWTVLHDGLNNLRVCLREDKPRTADSALIDLRADVVDDLIGRITDVATSWTGLPQKSVLLSRHRTLNELQRRLSEDLMSYERMRELLVVGRSYGGEGQAWARGVGTALGECQQTLFDLAEAIADGWCELVDRADGGVFQARGETSTGALISLMKNSEGDDRHAK